MVEIGPVVLEKRMKMWNVDRHKTYRLQDWQTTSNQKSSLELSAQLSDLKTSILSTTTHLYKNNLLGIAVIPWSDDDRWTFLVHHWQHHMWKEAPFEVSACKIMYKDCWWKNNPNWGFDCLNVNGLIRFYKKIQRMWLSHN